MGTGALIYVDASPETRSALGISSARAGRPVKNTAAFLIRRISSGSLIIDARSVGPPHPPPRRTVFGIVGSISRTLLRFIRPVFSRRVSYNGYTRHFPFLAFVIARLVRIFVPGTGAFTVIRAGLSESRANHRDSRARNRHHNFDRDERQLSRVCTNALCPLRLHYQAAVISRV